MKKFCALALITIIAFSCSKDDNDPTMETMSKEEEKEQEVENDSIVYFSVKIEDNVYTSTQLVNYIILNDDDGNLIDYRPLRNGNNLVFKTKKEEAPTTFSVSLSYYNNNSQYENIGGISTYFNVKSGSTWLFEENENDTYQETGTYSIQINNTVDIESYELRDFKTITSGEGYSNDSVIMIPYVRNYLNQFHFVSLTSALENKYYKFVSNPEQKNNLVLNFNDFKEYELSDLISIPQGYLDYSVGVEVLKDKTFFQTDQVNSLDLDTLGSTIKLLTVSNMEKYRLYFIEYKDNFTYYYDNYTKDYLSATIPDINSINLQISNNSIDNFKYNTNINYDRIRSQWRHTDTIKNLVSETSVWYFHANNDGFKVKPNLPKEVIDAIPNYKLENLKYYQTRLTRGGPTYEEIIYSNLKTDWSSYIGEVENIYFRYNTNKNKSRKVESEEATSVLKH
ncbi:hypothetical protein NBT05_05620 [Aquimarina sp. ERC-38]|uniref:hypothetical protein n=1 Tax=Aquimarina sp. ERC-38 TaxID=2949996 RepID=UPI002248165B|nr:hypothetical protein [Aquimarina sp. ERC-38]UZO81943.1 hypothetical protein NBT05_05620 [Aquimarina sp. ERC-38]